MEDEIRRQLLEGAELRRATASGSTKQIAEAATIIISAFKRGNKVLLCGNGGSAADSQHIAAELVGRFMKERKALPAIALSTDTSALTALSNDYGFDIVFKRQIEALGNRGDILIAISTSGNSKNIIAAAEEAKKKGLHVIGLSGKSGGKLKAKSDICICVPSDRTDRIQEVHIAIGHIICDLVEKDLFG
ncbi:MAG: D-sedoheptulose 7-phosphate isomerase [Candidatus Micrarchaeota archaeon]